MEITQENIERGERMKQAELKKCELAIEQVEQELAELKQPKGLFGSSNKKAIVAADEKLNKLKLHMIDLQAMNGAEVYEYMKSKEKTDNIKNVGSKVFNTAGQVIENVTGVIPGVSIAGKMIGKGFKTIGKSIKED
jgi:urease gamma subunit